MSNIELYLKEKKAMIDQLLPKYLPPADTYPKIIHEAMHYGVTAGGKRLRPLMALAAAEAVGEKNYEVLNPLLCALEYIHTYSLIHDDLPAMDNDDLRRGKPTCHRVYGDGIAILAGDALLTYAFELLTKLAKPYGHFSHELTLQIILKISYDIGTRGLIGGQVVDLDSENKLVDLDTLEFIHKHKTGALFKTSMLTGAMLGNATKEQIVSIGSYADALGLAFQITDDILDVKGDTALLGKTVGSDERKQKATYPSLLGMDEAEKLLNKCVQGAISALANFGEEADALRELIIYVANRKA